tara:strand:+ start:368 stop:652 length:285 start_codon:yes stop_codon:yes gene_type:complete
MPENFLSIISDLGGTMASLAFAGYLIVYLLKGFAEERKIHLDKDSRNDDELRSLMRESNAALIKTMEQTNLTLSEMRVAISQLHESIVNMERRS